MDQMNIDNVETLSDDKIIDLCQERGLNNFWKCLDFMLITGYDEIDSIMTSMRLFNGDTYCDLIEVIKVESSNETPDLFVAKVYLKTNGGNMVYESLYRSYVETMNYSAVKQIENHIECLMITLHTELGIHFVKKFGMIF